MPDNFDISWVILAWRRKDDEGAFGTVQLPLGDSADIRLKRTLTNIWYWLDRTPDDERIPDNEGDGTKGRYTQSEDKSANLEIRLAPRFERFEAADYDMGQGFTLQDGLAPHVGDRIHIYGVDCGELYSKETAMIPADYPWLSIEEFGAYPYAGLEVLSSQLEPNTLSEIWPHIIADHKTINMRNQNE